MFGKWIELDEQKRIIIAITMAGSQWMKTAHASLVRPQMDNGVCVCVRVSRLSLLGSFLSKPVVEASQPTNRPTDWRLRIALQSR